MSLLHELGLKMNYQLANGIDTNDDAIKSYCDGCSNACSNDCYGGCESSCQGGCFDSCSTSSSN